MSVLLQATPLLPLPRSTISSLLQIPNPDHGFQSLRTSASGSDSSPSRRNVVLVATSGGKWACRSSEDSKSRLLSVFPRTMILQAAAPALFFFIGIGAASLRHASACPTLTAPLQTATTGEESADSAIDMEPGVQNDELEREFEAWKKKKFALTVPIRIVALRGSFPPSWVKDFMQSQGSRARVSIESRGSLQSTFSELETALKRDSINPKSAMAADIVSIGDSWLSYAIAEHLIEPFPDAEHQKWFSDLSDVWKMFLHRNTRGEVDPDGKLWGVPYRCGSMVIAYKSDKFKRKGLAPIEDWRDLWRSDLTGRISMVNSPREVVGTVLKYMGASYNMKDMESEVPGGRNAVMQNLILLQKQVKLFDSVYYLKAFTTGDVWVAVGWSTDILPTAKRMSNVTVLVPKSGSSLWADLWAIPAASKFASSKIGGRTRGPSPLIHQWLKFCLQPARAFPFKQGMLPGLPPSIVGHLPKCQDNAMAREGNAAVPISEMPPSDVLDKCEFLEPLSAKALMDYKWVVSHMQTPPQDWMLRTFSPLLLTLKKIISNST